MEGFNLNNAPKFKTPEEELDFLRAHIKEREQSLRENKVETNKEKIAEDLVSSYKKYEPEEVLHKNAILKRKDIEQIVSRLHPETHDSKMEELLSILIEKGISNTLAIVYKMNNPHLDDDFHRYLVQYLSNTHKIPGLKESSPLFKSLNMKLFEITLPDANDEGSNKKSIKELLGAMEQFYAGMHSIGEGRTNPNRNHFTLEIALSEDSDNFVFYTAVPSDKADLFEKQLLGVHPNAKIIEKPDDYNIFSADASISASYATLSHNEAYPIKLYDSLDHDPLNIILNIFTKMKKTGEGASIQFTICPLDGEIISKYKTIISNLKSGMSIKMASSLLRQIASEFKNLASE
jgi:hypothetical protein